MRLTLALLSVLATVCSAYKMVIIGPSMSNSQILFNARVAEELSNAGHDVSLALINFFDDLEINVKIDPKIHLKVANASVGKTMKEMEEQQATHAFIDASFFDPEQRKWMAKALEMFQLGCRNTLRNKEFMAWLENEKFDLAFIHMYHACPLGLIHAAKIPSFVWLNSGGLMDFVADIVGVPLIPSYVSPMLMQAHDKMNFVERTKSFIGHTLMKVIWPRSVAIPETEVFRQEIDPNFPSLLELGKNCPLVMVNTNELYDLPRPTLAKIVNIGGVGYSVKKPKALAPEFQSIVDKAQGIIVFSFGSVAPSHRMPEHWKAALLGAFKRFPEYHFIMRYKSDDLKDRKSSNVHTFQWLPQADLLQNKKTVAFITHGGYNSMQETISAGVPMIAIPLFGDQPKNAMIAKKHGIAVTMEKSEISEEVVYNAIKAVIDQKTYSSTVKRMSQMVKHQPFKAEEKLVKWAEFLAEFKTLENLQPAGVHLNTFQYHSLDVIAFLGAIIFLVLFIVYKILAFIVRKVLSFVCPCQKAKAKSE